MRTGGGAPTRLASSFLAAGVVALLGFLVQPAAPARAGLDDSANASCPEASGIPRNTGSVIAFTGQLTCFRPGAPRFGGTETRPSIFNRLQDPSPRDPCSDVNFTPVLFAESDQGQIAANYGFSAGASASIPLSPDETIKAASFEAMVAEVRLGTYQPSVAGDPNSPLTCRLDPTVHSYCPGLANPVDQFCYIWIAHPVTPGTSPSPPWAPYFAAAIGNIKSEAGTIHSAPSQKGVVNTAVCFWIDNMGIPVERDLELILAGAPDSSGRQIFYTYLARIRFGNVAWDFDDPAGQTTVAAPPACGSPPQLVAHSYRQISDDRHGDRTYHVTARENYTISVEVFWADSDGLHHEPVDPGVDAPVISPAVYPQYVGQVEGVPIGGG